MSDVLIVRSGELRPEVTEPTLIGAVVRIPDGRTVAEAIEFARTVIPAGEYTELLRVIVAGTDEIEGSTDE